MAIQKRAKLTASATSEKTYPQKSVVQVEGKLSETQLEAIAAAGYSFN